MKVFIDTSIFIEYLKGNKTDLYEELSSIEDFIKIPRINLRRND
jgi:predicted nucleic acid-binding protein